MGEVRFHLKAFFQSNNNIKYENFDMLFQGQISSLRGNWLS